MNPESRRRLRAALDAEYARPHPSLADRVSRPPSPSERHRPRHGRELTAAAIAVLLATVVVATLVAVRHRPDGAGPAPAAVPSVAASPSPAASPVPTAAPQAPEPVRPGMPSDGSPAWFVTSQVGWEAADSGLRRTTSGGAGWTVQLVLPYPKLMARDVRFLDERTGFVLALTPSGGHSESVLYATSDGDHWVRHALPPSDNPAVGMDFVSAMEGYVLLEIGSVPTLEHTTDGGRTWQQVSAGTAAGATPVPGRLPAATIQLGGLRFLDATHGWVAAQDAGGPALYSTADGGHTWQAQRLPVPASLGASALGTATLEPPRFTDSTHGYAELTMQQAPSAASGPGKFGSQVILFYRTADGGRTWSLGGVSPPGSLAGTILDEEHLLVVTETGVQVSADRGATWTSPGSLPSRASWVDFVNPRDGFAGDPGSRNLLVTADGGRTWRSVPT